MWQASFPLYLMRGRGSARILDRLRESILPVGLLHVCAGLLSAFCFHMHMASHVRSVRVVRVGPS